MLMAAALLRTLRLRGWEWLLGGVPCPASHVLGDLLWAILPDVHFLVSFSLSLYSHCYLPVFLFLFSIGTYSLHLELYIHFFFVFNFEAESH